MDIVCLSECLIVVLTAGMFDVYHFFAASSSILSGIFWLLLVFTNVGNPITKLACGNGLYHPCMIVLGMV